MQNNYNTNGKYLTYSEQLLIERWKNKENKSNRIIAKLLGKAPQTINNEIKRGAVDLTFHGEGISYSADNGSVFQQLEEVIQCPIYYCHP